MSKTSYNLRLKGQNDSEDSHISSVLSALKDFIEETINTATAELRSHIRNLETKIDDLQNKNERLLALHVAEDNHHTVHLDGKEADKNSSSDPIYTRMMTNAVLPSSPRPTTSDAGGKSEKSRVRRPAKASGGGNIIFGNGRVQTSDGFAATPRNIWLYVGRCKADTTVDDVRNYLNSKTPNYTFDIVKLDTKGPNSSFRVGADPSLENVLYDADFWPSGMLVKRYFFPGRKGARRNPQRASSSD